MATTYRSPDPDDQVLEILAEVIDRWHPDLKEHEVRIGVIFASNPDGDAVRHNGYPAAATIRIVPLKDRTVKPYDAEMLIDEHFFENARPQLRLALLDHECSHLTLAKTRLLAGGKKECDRDDLGRPKLRLRKGDWNVGDGFKAVVARHGDDAIEFQNIRYARRLAEAAARGEAADVA